MLKKGKIVVHAGTSNRFVEDAALLFSTKSKIADYHDSMDINSCEKLISMLGEP